MNDFVGIDVIGVGDGLRFIKVHRGEEGVWINPATIQALESKDGGRTILYFDIPQWGGWIV